MKKTVCLDFNGVLDDYSGWIKNGVGTEYTPKAGAAEFLQQLSQQYRIVILTVINPTDVWEWLCKHQLDEHIDDVTSIKPPAIAYIDDRAIRFDGDYEQTLQQLQNFKPYWEE